MNTLLNRKTFLIAGEMIPKLRGISRSVSDRMNYEESGEEDDNFPYDKPSVVWEKKQIENSWNHETVVSTGKVSINPDISWEVEGELFRTTGETIFGTLSIDRKVYTIISYESKTGGFKPELESAGFVEVDKLNAIIVALLQLCNLPWSKDPVALFE